MNSLASQWFTAPLKLPTSVESKRAIEIVQLTDCHLMLDGQLYEGVNSLANLRRVLDDIAKNAPDLLVVTGDITQDHTLNSYRLLSAACFEKMPNIPVVWLPGNHDDISDLKQAFAEAESFYDNKHIQFTDDASQDDKANWHILLLNTKGPTPSGKVAAEHSEQITQLLSQIPTSDSVFVFCHHHPLAMDAYIDKHILEDGENLLAMLTSFVQVKGLAHGHVHQERETLVGSLRLLATPASSIQFKPHSKTKANDDKGPGYRRIQLNMDGSFDTEVIWLSD